MDSLPVRRFVEWFEEARRVARRDYDFNAMCLSTVAENGMPSSRIVLLKEVDENGFVFYTNKHSRKSRELYGNQAAALCFYWSETGKQVRVQGYVTETSDEESDEYFATRNRGRQIGAWASDQSAVLDDRATLEAKVEEVTRRFEGVDVPRPPHWGGWRLHPTLIEFWENGTDRLHAREVFTRDGGGFWQSVMLNP